ncbi:hypothetical protein QBC44DRAFT_119190 [Cladorrhinum sp. PSN332]|nr:hypothetical protein QBC44DRAFT_119190 [Cladorrhinum sp. PSN332]
MGPADSRRQRPEGHRGDVPETSPQRRNDESWVEVTSQPSSSSLSSIGDDIVTTGLRVGNNSYAARRRRPQQHRPMPASFIVGRPVSHAGATSSQEEYDETESEEDRVMTSSTEAAHPSANLLRQQTAVRAGLDTDSDSDDDENATALGRPTNSTGFRPQPNAFSHPPSHLTHRHSTSSAHQYHPSQSRPSMSRAQTRPSRGGPHDILSPSYQADNDAALRASLTTLLSCAAAARGIPKGDERPRSGVPGPGMGGAGAGVGVLPSSQPMELRLVPESELMSENPPPPSAGAMGLPKVPLRTASNSSAPSAPSSTSSREREQRDANEKSKRAASGQAKPVRATKKKRTGLVVDSDNTTFISPTLIPWVVGAGVVVLISVVGFGAGYVIGREVGRQENVLSLGSAGSASNATASCGRDLVRSTSGGTLRRFRWGGMGKSVAA